VSNLPAPGTHVSVPWGVSTAEGEVVESYQSGIGGRVVVAVRIEGADDALTVTFPAEVVKLVELA
jgi:hypothetical protein